MSDNTKSDATSDDTQNDKTDDQTDKQDDDADQIEGLGEAGKVALRKEREARAVAEKSRKDTEKQLRDAAKRLKDFEDAGKSELEKATGERDTWKESATDYRDKYRKANAAEQIRSKALELGADPKRVDRIVRLVRPDVAFGDDSDDPTNVDALVAGLKKSDADLFAVAVGKADGGAGGGGKPKDDPNAGLRRAFGRTP